MSLFLRILPSPLALVAGVTLFALWEKHGDFEASVPPTPQTQISTTIAVVAPESTEEAQSDAFPVPGSFETAIARPLFIEGREPILFHEDQRIPTITDDDTLAVGQPDKTLEVATPEQAPPAIEPPRPEIDLRGYMDEGTRAAALVFDFQRSSEYWLHVGDAVGEWTVAAVTPRSVTFRADGFEFVVTLFE